VPMLIARATSHPRNSLRAGGYAFGGSPDSLDVLLARSSDNGLREHASTTLPGFPHGAASPIETSGERIFVHPRLDIVQGNGVRGMPRDALRCAVRRVARPHAPEHMFAPAALSRDSESLPLHGSNSRLRHASQTEKRAHSAHHDELVQSANMSTFNG
jgi:hypothetical protein